MGHRIMLNYPPASSPWHLPVGTSWLTAVLRCEGHQVIQRYGHIIGLEHILRKHGGRYVELALTAVRNPKSRVSDLYKARMILERVSRALPTKDVLVIERNNVRYSSHGFDGTLDSLINRVRHGNESIWHRYFADVEIPLAQKNKPDIYGVSINDERQLVPGCILARMIKTAIPGTMVVLGGNIWSRLEHVFLLPEFAELFKFCDAIVYSEGFEPLKQLATALDQSTTPGVVWWNGNKVVVNRKPLTATPFETLPTPAYGGAATIWCPETVIPFYGTSNCVFHCLYCAISGGSDTYLMRPRMMSSQRIADHIAALAPHGGRFDFFDETLSIVRQLRMAQELRARGLDATWQCYMTITKDLLDPGLCHDIYTAGCRAVQLGLETLSYESLQREDKKWNHPDSYGQILSNLADAGIQVHAFIIAGIIGEKSTDTLRWLPFIKDHGDAVLTWKPSRYRLARRSPEEQDGKNNDLIEVLPDTAPLLLNRAFRYKPLLRAQTHATRSSGGRHSVGKDVEAVLLLIEEACRRHWAYALTSTIPWWTNRGRFALAELREMAKVLPEESPDPRLPWALQRVATIVEIELGQK
jgi:hypothetical protein